MCMPPKSSGFPIELAIANVKEIFRFEIDAVLFAKRPLKLVQEPFMIQNKSLT